MFYIILTSDKSDSAQVRGDNRPEHLDYLDSFGDKLIAAGARPSSIHRQTRGLIHNGLSRITTNRARFGSSLEPDRNPYYHHIRSVAPRPAPPGRSW
jgi:hypothetical protein